MRRVYIFAMMILMFFSLTACSEYVEEPLLKVVEIAGKTGTIKFDKGTHSAGTITMENGEYKFIYDTNGEITITYPDGYIYTQTNMNGAYATPADYDVLEVEAKGYIDGFSLVWGIESAIDERSSNSKGSASPFLAIALVGLGAWNFFAPKSAWWLARGWWYKNAEPSELAVGLYRIGGVLLIFIGILSGNVDRESQTTSLHRV